MSPRRFTIVLALALAGLPATARPQALVDGFYAQHFDPTPAGDRFFAAPDATVDGHLQPSVKLTLNYGYGALRIVDEKTGQAVPGGNLLKDQLYLHLDASLALFHRVEVTLGLPFAVYQSGESVLSGGHTASPSLSDFRLGARVNFLGKPRDSFALGFAADVWFPTGSVQDFASDPDVRAHPRLVASGLLAERFAYSAALGAMIRAHHDVGLTRVGTAVTYSAAGAILFLDQRLQVGPELYGSVTPISGAAPLEGMLGAHLCFPSFVLGAGVGAGLTRAPGAAQARVVASFEWTPGRQCGAAAPDADGDGVPDQDDACPTVAGEPSRDPARNGCPPPSDRDQDRIVDDEDACPDVAGSPSKDPKRNGCPADTDGDGILDADDACPDAAGVPNADLLKNGCPPPPDRDRDGVADEKDACPDEPGVKGADPKKHGCPAGPPDKDRDGIADADDACPDVPGVKDASPKKNGCPPDRDADGIADVDDACLDVPGVKDADPAKNGCPPDRDADGIADKDDACPEAAGPASKDKKKHGCPPDKDNDGVADARDACPDKAGPASEDPKKNGCPAIAVLRKDSIVILQQVQFDTGKATIRPASNKLLNEVASILREHPEIAALSIEGHTDDRGNAAANRTLSQNRAEAVKEWLYAKGKVERFRMGARGFGPDRPVDTNKTEKGRQNNRRVEFKIVPKLDYTPEPEPARTEPVKVEPAKKAEPAKVEPKAPPKKEPKKAPPPQDDPLAPLTPAKKAPQPVDDPLAPLTPAKKAPQPLDDPLAPLTPGKK